MIKTTILGDYGMDFTSDTSFCGVDCTQCPVYRATKDSDDKLREKVAIEWSRIYKLSLSKEDINCLGCRSELIFKMCLKCHFRDCTSERSINSCLKCSDYPCSRLGQFYDWNNKQVNKTFNI